MSNVQKITLGESSFDIPELPLGVKRKTWAITSRMANRAREARLIGEGALHDAIACEENISDALELIFLGIEYGKPNFTRADLDNIVDVGLDEVLAAATTIAMQAGGKKVGEKKAAEPAALETPSPIANPTGTES